jgi:ubiquinone/menaquinone biosynthesis C-methylase UbiE
MHSKRLINEKLHGKKLLASDAEKIWNWKTPTGKVRAERRANYFVDKGKIKSTDTILEIGCGTGIFTTKVFEKTGAQITAIDISEVLLEEAKKKIPAVRFIEEDAMGMSFNNNTFDVVFGSSVLHHLDFDKALHEIYRVLKTGGKMVFAEPNMLNPQIFLQKNIPFLKRMLGDSPDETAVVRWKIKKMMEHIGFKKVEIFPYDFLHPVTPVFMISLVNSAGKIIEKIPLLREIAGSVIIYAEKK